MRTPGLVVAFVLALSGTAAAAFPQSSPNDPNYDAAERNCAAKSINDEQHYLYSKLSACTPGATDPDGAAGMSIDAAWKQFTPGRPDTTIAYVEAGINWFAADAKDLADRVYLNVGELPPPTTPVDDGRLSARDYADTKDANGNGLVDPEDIIVRFSDGKDDDHNGYTDDISGWDFYDDQNDPATVDGAYLHANNQERQAAAQADNAFLGAGICPDCTIVPVKAGAEALDRTDDLAQAWLYAADAGADVIVSVTADLGYSSFMRQTVESLWKRNVVMVEASNDFDSVDHQGGMFWPHVIPGNALVTSSHGVPGPAANALTTTFRSRSGETSWGPKNFLSVSTQTGATSSATPTVGGVFALLLSEGKNAAEAHQIDAPLSNAEAVQVARATASDIDDRSSNWPSSTGFDLQFGYGRPHVLRAMQAISKGDIPPVGWISSPDWYALFDPTRDKVVNVTGHVEARRSTGYAWKLDVAPGAEPVDADFFAAGTGGGAKAFDGKLGSFDLARIPKSFWAKAFTLSKTKTLETSEQYNVTLRLRVTDAQGRVGEDRRTISVHQDPTWRPGFPRRIGHGGDGQPQLADLQGRGREAIVFGDADGIVHAVDSASGAELPGWPVTTDATKVTVAHRGIDPGHEPMFNNVAVGSLDGTGDQSVVATSTTGRTYVWNASGKRRAGWPRTLDDGVKQPAIPRPRMDITRLPHQGAFSPPVLVDLDGDGKLDVVQGGWDGRIHAWHADGSDVKGWPVEVTVPAAMPPLPGYLRLNDHKLEAAPTVADLDGDGKPELVQRSQYFDIVAPDLDPAGFGFLHAYHANGTAVRGFPRRLPALVVFYNSAQEFITEGANVPATADVDGDGDDEIGTSAIFSPATLIDGDGSTKAIYGVSPGGSLAALNDPAALLAGGKIPDDTQVSFTTSGAFGRVGGGSLTYAQPGSGAASVAGALLVNGSGQPIINSMRAFDATSGAPRPGFPAESQGLDFLGAPLVADVTGDGKAELLEGGDSSAMHGFGADGKQVADFPKWTTGWVLYAPAVGDVDGDGRNEIAALTREGYLFVWNTKGRSAGDDEWWSFRHDERNTGHYGTDTRPPAGVRGAKAGRESISFRASGDDWLAGTAKAYVVQSRGRELARATPSGASGTIEHIDVPGLAGRRVTVRAVDDAGNIGPGVRVGRGAPARACLSRRRFVVQVPTRVNTKRVVSARVTATGASVSVRRRGGRFVATVHLRRRTRGTVRVTIVVRTAGRQRPVTLVREYRSCAPLRPTR